MGNAPTPAPQQSQLVNSKYKYYFTSIAGLRVQLTSKPAKDQIAPQFVNFVSYRERYQGDQRTVGYLKTDNSDVIERLKDDPNVIEITQKEYDEATKSVDEETTEEVSE